MSAAAGAAAIAQAVRVSGVIVHLTPEEFQRLLGRTKEPLVVVAEGGFLGKTYRYLTSCKGLAFHTQSSLPLHLPSRIETITAKKMWIP
jgi:hypothetical protein